MYRYSEIAWSYVVRRGFEVRYDDGRTQQRTNETTPNEAVSPLIVWLALQLLKWAFRDTRIRSNFRKQNTEHWFLNRVTSPLPSGDWMIARQLLRALYASSLHSDWLVWFLFIVEIFEEESDELVRCERNTVVCKVRFQRSCVSLSLSIQVCCTANKWSNTNFKLTVTDLRKTVKIKIRI